MNDLFWTDERWDKFKKQQVTIPVTLLEALIAGVEVLVIGGRPDEKGRANWAKVTKEAEPYLSAIKAKIGE